MYAKTAGKFLGKVNNPQKIELARISTAKLKLLQRAQKVMAKLGR